MNNSEYINEEEIIGKIDRLESEIEKIEKEKE